MKDKTHNGRKFTYNNLLLSHLTDNPQIVDITVYYLIQSWTPVTMPDQKKLGIEEMRKYFLFERNLLKELSRI